MSQMALPLSHRSEADPAKIIVGSANEGVAEALADPASWPYHTAILAGPPRSGKSLLGRWFAAKQLGNVVDGADKMDETELFHRWNRSQEMGEALLLIIDGQGWDIALPDLRSRIGAALQLEIGPPDDDMASSLLLSHAQQCGLALGDGAAAYLVPRMERSHAAVEKITAAINRLSLERKAPATLSIWRDALEAVQGPEQARLI